MDRWRAAGRASRADDDALWERFRAAQDAFFTAKDQVAAAEDEEFRANLVVKEEILLEAEALLPVTDVETAKASLRGIQDRWEKAGKVPRADLERVEKRMRRVETAVREADEQRWTRTNPEVAARARSLVDQLEASVAAIEADVAPQRRRATPRRPRPPAVASPPSRSGWSRPGPGSTSSAADPAGVSRCGGVPVTRYASKTPSTRCTAAHDVPEVRRVAHLEGELRARPSGRATS